MNQALELARNSVGLASPNPTVGCVLVKNGAIVGQGFHEYRATGSCRGCGTGGGGGRGPRSDGLRDTRALLPHWPNSSLYRGPDRGRSGAGGGGYGGPQSGGEWLGDRAAAGRRDHDRGGFLARQAQELNDGFARYIQTRLPFVILKAGLSLDGRIAPPPGRVPVGAPVMLTGEESRTAVQRIRHSSDVLITGINTVLTDDPLLTDRTGLPRRRRLLRVVLDSALRLRLDCEDRADSSGRCAGVLYDSGLGTPASARSTGRKSGEDRSWPGRSAGRH